MYGNGILALLESNLIPTPSNAEARVERDDADETTRRQRDNNIRECFTAPPRHSHMDNINGSGPPRDSHNKGSGHCGP